MIQPQKDNIILHFSKSSDLNIPSAERHMVGVLSFGGGILDWKPFPKSVGVARRIFGTDQILLSIGRIPDSWLDLLHWSLPKAYLYDPSTGKMRKLS